MSKSPEELRVQDAERITAALALAVKALEGADHYAPLWADDVRWAIETRQGRAYEPDDPAILADVEYGKVLDFMGNARRVLAEVRELAGQFERIEASS